MHKTQLQCRGHHSQPKEDPPVVLGVLHTSADGNSNCLTEWDAEAVGSDATSADCGRRQLSDVRRADDTGSTNTDSEDQATHSELSEAEAKGDNDGTDSEEQVRDQQARFPAPFVCESAQDGGAKDGANGSCSRGNLLLGVGKLLAAKVGANVR